jgi:uncharacterized protein YbjT (DUF2867 family)
MSGKILITGASGNIGTALQQELAASGLDYVLGTRRHGEINASAPTRTVDFGERAQLERALEDIETVFLLLPLVQREQMREWTRNVVEAARGAGVKRIVRSSGIGADADSPHGLMALQGELDDLVRESGLEWTIIRPATFMQNFATMMNEMVRGGALYLPQADARTAFVDTRDIAAVIVAVLQSPADHAGQTLDVTGPEALDNAAVMSTIGKELERELEYVPVDEDTAHQAMGQQGMPDWLVAHLMSLHAATRDGVAAPVSRTVERVTGRAPRSFADFARDHAGAWQ